LTLYELCTLTHAINAQDRAQVVQQISQQLPAPPRKIDNQVPRDLETIVLKAIEKSPRSRYQSARQMAEDLRLYLSDRPIQARRASTTERVWRWCRRNPLQAGLLACVAALLLILAGGAVAFGVASRQQATLLRQENLRAVTAETEAVHRLYESEVAHAQASRWSRRPGQHFASLEAIHRAARLLPRLDIPSHLIAEQQLVLRNEAIAAVTLYDVRERLSLDNSEGWTSAVALSPDFERYALSDKEGRVAVRRVADGEQLHLLDGPGHRAWVMRFSEDGRYLAGKFHKGTPEPTPPVIIVWDLTSEQRVVFHDTGLDLAAFAFSEASNLFAFCDAAGLIQVCSLEHGKTIHTRQVDSEPTAVEFNREGSKLAVSSFGHPSLAVWDLPTDEMTAVAAHACIKSLDWSPNDRWIAIGCADGCIHLLDVDDEKPLKLRLTGHISNVVGVYFNKSGDVLVSRSWDGTTRLWDLSTGANSLQIGHGGHVMSGFSSANDAIGFVHGDKRFGIWEIACGGPLRVLHDQDRMMEKRRSAFHPQADRLLGVATAEGLELWDVARQKLVHVLDSGDTQSVMFLPDGHTLLTCGKRGVLSWPVNVYATTPLEIHIGAPHKVTDKVAGQAELDFRGTQLAFDHAANTALVVDLPSGEIRELANHLHLNTITSSPDGKWVVTATWQGRGIRVWDVPSGQCLVDLLPEASSASVRFSPNGEWLAASDGAASYIWRTSNWELIHELAREHPDGWPGPIAFSPDSSVVAMPHSRYVAQLTDPVTGKTLGVLEAPSRSSLVGYSFNADGTRLAITEGSRIQLWDVAELRSRLEKMELDWDTPAAARRMTMSPDEPMTILVDR
jgi:WD40 repeat protein